MKDSDSISKKSSSDSENLVNKIVPEMPKDKRTKAYKEWVKKYGQKASDSNEIPEMPKDKRTKAYKEWVKQYGGQEVTSDKSEKKSSKKDSTPIGDDNKYLSFYISEKLKQEHFDFFIFGHLHKPLEINLNSKSKYINLGDWISHFTYASFEGTKLELKKWEIK